MKFNHRIFRVSIILCLIIWLVFLGISYSLLHSHTGFDDGHNVIAFIVIYIGGIISSRIIIHYTEKQLISAKRLSESESYLQLQFEKMPNAYILWDNNFKVIKWNPTAERVFGYKESEMIAKSALETIVPKNQKQIVSEVWATLIEKKTELKSTNENSTKDGRIIICEWTNNPIVDKNGEVTEVISMVQDITISKRIEDCLHFIATQEWDKDDSFFHKIAEYLAKQLNFDYVIISKVDKKELNANSIAYYAGSKFLNNVVYKLKGSPCENVYGKKL